MQGFTLIVNFVMFPTFLLSGALFPVQDLPSWLVPVCYANPLTYGVDGLRGVLLGAEASGVPILLDFVLITAFSIGMVGIGSYLFESTEVER
jgi:ABC-2 type transport system permease protein